MLHLKLECGVAGWGVQAGNRNGEGVELTVKARARGSAIWGMELRLSPGVLRTFGNGSESVRGNIGQEKTGNSGESTVCLYGHCPERRIRGGGKA